MRILVVGRGGREHAICWALKKSPKVKELYCAPGNAGIAQVAELVDLQEFDFEAIGEFALDHGLDLVVIGPDDPLAAGIVDHLEKLSIPVFGPRKNAAQIEGSKVFAKNIMKKYNIPTAAYETFDQYEAALAYVREQGAPIVIKADGLAAGKGVIVAQTLEEAEAALQTVMLDMKFGSAGTQVVIEEFMTGEEMSLLAFVDGETVRPMVPSQDHKPVFDGDKGPNTGGMGTYSPVPHMSQALIDEAVESILKPCAKALVEEGCYFRGVLYAGLMITPNGVRTVEFNARFGDPETQVILSRLETDLSDIFMASINGRLADMEIKWSEQAACCVIMASEGYPESSPKGRVISGLDQVSDAVVFHAGSAQKDGQVVTNGGRVLGVTALGEDFVQARAKAYEAVNQIHFEGAHYRKDIALKAMRAAGLVEA
jgi:phosphoribosylamine--glycine ligase